MIERDASLRGMNSFGVPARAAGLARLHDLDALPALLDDPGWRDRPLLVLGGGSNVLFTGDFDGLVLRIEAERIAHSRRDGDDTMVRVEAGRDWHDFVRWTLDAGHPGLENLSLIPGTVGAAPIQNIGAYGVEVESCIEAVEAWDRRARAFVALDRAACGFAYRDSVFKREGWHLSGRMAITSVVFRLPKVWQPNLRYADVAQELAARNISAPTPQDVADAIIAIRRRKLPDPAVTPNAGSFFHNPPISRYARLSRFIRTTETGGRLADRTVRLERLSRRRCGLP